MSTATVVRDPGRLGSLEDGWRGLAALAGNPYLTPEWHAACSSRPGAQPVVVAVRSGDGALRGVLPLVRVLGPGALARFLGDDLGDDYAMLARARRRPLEAARLAGRPARGRRTLGRVRALLRRRGRPLAERASRRSGRDGHDAAARPRPYVDLSAGDWAGYLSRRSSATTARRPAARAPGARGGGVLPPAGGPGRGRGGHGGPLPSFHDTASDRGSSLASEESRGC